MKIQKIKKAEKLAYHLINISDLDIFKNTRKAEYIEARAVFNFVAYNEIKMTLSQIKDFYRHNGKHYDHATVLHSLKTFDVYKKFSPKVQKWLDELHETDVYSDSFSLSSHYLKFLNLENTDKAYRFIRELYEEQMRDKLELKN